MHTTPTAPARSFDRDPDVLHICFCSTNYESADGTKIDVACPSPFEDERERTIHE